MANQLTAEQLSAQAVAHSAHNYHPLPVVIASAEGAWVTDVSGRRYLDLLAAYSALNFGHRHPRLVAAAQRQLERVTLVSRAFEHDQLDTFSGNTYAAIGGYNAGPEASREWLRISNGDPDLYVQAVSIDSTQMYVRRAYEQYEMYALIYTANP